MQNEPLTPVERLQVHLILQHHEEDADAFALVESLIRNYALEDPETLTEDAKELQGLLLGVIDSWTPPQTELETERDRYRDMLNAALDDNWEDVELSAYRVIRSRWTP